MGVRLLSYFFRLNTLKGIPKVVRCGPFEAETSKLGSTETVFLGGTTSSPVLFIWEFPPGSRSSLREVEWPHSIKGVWYPKM